MLTDEQKAFLLANTHLTYKELTRELNFQFGLNRSRATIEYFFANRRVRPKRLTEHVSQAEVDYVRQIAPLHPPETVLSMLNDQFGQNRCIATLYRMYRKHAIRHKTITNQDGSYAGRNVRWNLGGRMVRTTRNRAVYMREHGEIPKNHFIVFLDNDRHNYSAENLFCVPWSAQHRASRSGLLTSDPERNRAVYLTFMLQHKSEILRRPPRVRRRASR